VPGGVAFCIASPRRRSRRAAVATSKAPAAVSALYSPSEWPANSEDAFGQHEAALRFQRPHHGERMGHQRRLVWLAVRVSSSAGPSHISLDSFCDKRVVHFLEDMPGGGEGFGEVAAHADGLTAWPGKTKANAMTLLRFRSVRAIRPGEWGRGGACQRPPPGVAAPGGPLCGSPGFAKVPQGT